MLFYCTAAELVIVKSAAVIKNTQVEQGGSDFGRVFVAAVHDSDGQCVYFGSSFDCAAPCCFPCAAAPFVLLTAASHSCGAVACCWLRRQHGGGRVYGGCYFGAFAWCGSLRRRFPRIPVELLVWARILGTLACGRLRFWLLVCSGPRCDARHRVGWFSPK